MRSNQVSQCGACAGPASQHLKGVRIAGRREDGATRSVRADADSQAQLRLAIRFPNGTFVRCPQSSMGTRGRAGRVAGAPV
jgi:hypothetical protein